MRVSPNRVTRDTSEQSADVPGHVRPEVTSVTPGRSCLLAPPTFLTCQEGINQLTLKTLICRNRARRRLIDPPGVKRSLDPSRRRDSQFMAPYRLTDTDLFLSLRSSG